MNTGIYKIKNKVNGKFYIGQTGDSFQSRWDKLKNNNHHNKHLQAAYNKYGEDNFEFEVIITCPAETKTLDFWEELFLRDHWDKDYCYNRQEGGGSNGSPSEETKKLMSAANTGEKHWSWGKPSSQKQKEAARQLCIERNKNKNPMKGRPAHNRRKVKVVFANGETQTWESLTFASEDLGMASHAGIRKAIKRGGWGFSSRVRKDLRGATIEYL